jgi:hypothetical protein
MMTHVIVFLFDKLLFSLITLAGFGRQAIVKLSLLTLAKILGPTTKWLTAKAYQAMIPVRL